MRKIWKDLEVSESEKQLAEEIRNGGIGKTLTDEETKSVSGRKRMGS